MADNKGQTLVPLQAHNISVDLGAKTIIDSINATVESGCMTVLVGPNGAGKSTLLAALSGHLPVSSGKICLANVNIKQLTPAELSHHRAVMLQSDNLVFDFTVSDVIRMGLVWQFESSESEQNQVITEMAEKCGIGGLLDQSILTLSGGEKQRVHFCRCLIQISRKCDNDSPGFLLTSYAY